MLTRLLLTLCLLSPVTAYAFPDNAVLENCTGVDDTTPPNANWTNAALVGATSANIRIRSNGCTTATNGTEADAYWDTTSFNASQEAYAEMIVVSGSTSYSCVYARLANIGANTTDGYQVCWFNGNLEIYRIDNGAATLLGATIAQAADANDQIGIKTVGDQICAWFKDDASAWGEAGCRTDSTYSAGGFIGWTIKGGNTVAVGDNFGGGNLSATRRPSAPIIFSWLWNLFTPYEAFACTLC